MENRFRDPKFVEIWQRWQNARSAWAKASKNVPFSEGGPDMRYNPDPDLVVDPKWKVVAREFIDARAVYKADLARRAEISTSAP